MKSIMNNNALMVTMMLLGIANATWTFATLKDQLMLSYSAYCSTYGLPNWDCYWCNQTSFTVSEVSLISNTSSNIFGYTGVYGGNTILVSFRGTQLASLKNWIEDLDSAELTPFPGVPGAYVHDGFWYSYQTIQDQVWQQVEALAKKYPNYAIQCSGHSLGGALAVLAAADLHQHYGKISIVNFGQPRVGNTEFAEYIDSFVTGGLITRVINQRDIVPHLPPRILNFWHCPQEVWFKSDYNHFQLCSPTNGEDLSCSDSYVDVSVLDHIQYLGFDERDGHPHGCGETGPY